MMTLDFAGCFRRTVGNAGMKLAILVGNYEGALFCDISMLSLCNTKYSLYFYLFIFVTTINESLANLDMVGETRCRYIH